MFGPRVSLIMGLWSQQCGQAHGKAHVYTKTSNFEVGKFTTVTALVQHRTDACPRHLITHDSDQMGVQLDVCSCIEFAGTSRTYIIGLRSWS